VSVYQVRADAPALCLPIALALDSISASPTFGQILCDSVEAHAGGGCDCGRLGRSPTPPSLIQPVLTELRAAGKCDATGQPACDTFCMCDIEQESGAAAKACQSDPAAATNGSIPPGFCYANDPSSPVLASCPTNEKQKLVFVGSSAAPTPSSGSVVFLACFAG
jgi:hypothetical protein